MVHSVVGLEERGGDIVNMQLVKKAEDKVMLYTVQLV